MDLYSIRYSKGGQMGYENANNHIDAIIRNASKVMSNVRFFETLPAEETNLFIVTNIKTEKTKYYTMIVAA